MSRAQFEWLAVAINTGTNIPSVATPNGQAAFLFLLTSTLAPLIRLGYGRMVWMALPYFVVMTVVGLAGAGFGHGGRMTGVSNGAWLSWHPCRVRIIRQQQRPGTWPSSTSAT